MKEHIRAPVAALPMQESCKAIIFWARAEAKGNPQKFLCPQSKVQYHSSVELYRWCSNSSLIRHSRHLVLYSWRRGSVRHSMSLTCCSGVADNAWESDVVSLICPCHPHVESHKVIALHGAGLDGP